MLLWLGERPPRRVDEPRRDDGEHVELLAGVGRQVRTGDEVMPGGGDQTEELQLGKVEQRFHSFTAFVLDCQSVLQFQQVPILS